MLCPVCGSSVPATALSCPMCGNPLTAQTLSVGTLLGGKYRIDAVLGQGGFGITYAATQLTLKTEVAIKELFPSGAVRRGKTIYPPSALTGEAWQRAKADFTGEAQVLTRFKHPDIVHVSDLFEEGDTAYMVMERLSGETLQELLNRRGALPAAEVEPIALRVSHALELVHKAQLLHRDIKPDNIFLETSGRVVLIDFGSARTFESGKTMQHTRMVTPGYAPLEQYGSAMKFGPYTDIYALGATLYHALSGQMPPSAPDLLQGTPLPPLPSSTPSRLRRAVEWAMKPKVADRPQTIAELLGVLQPAAAAPAAVSVPPAPPVPPVPPAPSTPRRSPVPPPRPAPQPAPNSRPTSTKRKSNPSRPFWIFLYLLAGVGGYWLAKQYPAHHASPQSSASQRPAASPTPTSSEPQPTTKTQPTTEPQPTTETQPSQVVPPAEPISDAEVTQLVDEYLRAGEAQDMSGAMGLYTSQVDYLQRGLQDLSAVATDKNNYFKRWPRRSYQRITAVNTLSEEGNTRQVRFDLRYDVANAQRELTGTAYTILDVVKQDGQLKIAGEHGEIYPETQTRRDLTAPATETRGATAAATAAPRFTSWHFGDCQDEASGLLSSALIRGRLQNCPLVIETIPNGASPSSAVFNYELEYVDEYGDTQKFALDASDHWPPAPDQPTTVFRQNGGELIFILPLQVKDRPDRQYNSINVTGIITFDNGSTKNVYERLPVEGLPLE